MKVLLTRFHLNGYTIRFRPQIEKLESPSRLRNWLWEGKGNAKVTVFLQYPFIFCKVKTAQDSCWIYFSTIASTACTPHFCWGWRGWEEWRQYTQLKSDLHVDTTPIMSILFVKRLILSFALQYKNSDISSFSIGPRTLEDSTVWLSCDHTIVKR